MSASRPRNPAKKSKSVHKALFFDLLRSPGAGVDPFKSCAGSNIPDAELFMHHCVYPPELLCVSLLTICRLFKLQVEVLSNGTGLSREAVLAGSYFAAMKDECPS